jgi:hypothetical protein
LEDLREQLVHVALAWERAFGNTPQITTVLSEHDAARLVGCSADAYSCAMQGATAVQRGHDFVFNGARYQVKGNRPSGKRGSLVTWVPKATNYDWDYLIWILYDSHYRIQEAWEWDVSRYRDAFDQVDRLSPAHLRLGKQLA